mgnify:CR=1 FL=1
MLVLAFLVQTFRIAIPYLFASAGGVLSERVGLIGLTLEGYMLGGAFCAVVATEATGNPWIGVLAGMAALWVLARVLGFFSLPASAFVDLLFAVAVLGFVKLRDSGIGPAGSLLGAGAIDGCVSAVMLAMVRILPTPSDQLVARSLGRWDQLEPILSHLDLFCPSRTEAQTLTGESEPKRMVAAFRRHMPDAAAGGLSEIALMAVRHGVTRALIALPPRICHVQIASLRSIKV